MIYLSGSLVMCWHQSELNQVGESCYIDLGLLPERIVRDMLHDQTDI